MKNNCCKGCNKRKLGCHSKCEEYALFKSIIEEVKKARKDNDYYTYGFGKAYKKWEKESLRNQGKQYDRW